MQIVTAEHIGERESRQQQLQLYLVFVDTTGSRATLLVGSVKQNCVPRGGLSAAHKRPPCDSTMERLIRSPMPVP